jgi:membrane associated rhomboid family serine protease
MRSAAVGQHCIECVRAGGRSVAQPRTQFGGRERSAIPVVTYALIAINVFTFILQMAIGNLERQLALWPPAVADGQFYRLVTAAFLHYGPTHLLLNMWALYVVGPPLEMWLGRLRFGALYALSGLGGSVLVYLLAPLNTATAGASGAVFGLFGATFVVARRLNLDFRSYRDHWPSTPLVAPRSAQGHAAGWSQVVIAAAYVYPSREHQTRSAAVTVFR